ncbi:hypothetical protein [Pseudomonas pseudonitroreducens]|uniref:hypothetical protein n=1 Tax=Pseudomonas pseudonitroreducens TaxID=2892326 RepID=UPI001F3676F5|nr:hypothetical protein [Pseudomonas pseudonitroreducens]
MNSKFLAFPAFFVALAGCGPQSVSPEQALANGWVSVPTLPLVQDAVRSLAPTFNGKQIPVLVDHLCALGEGRITPQQNVAELARLGIDVARLPRESTDALALLGNGDRAGQLAACAADQASAAFVPLKPSEVLHVQPAANAGDGKAKGDDSQPAIDQQAVSRLLSLKLSQARADSDIFAIIASRLAALPGLSEPDYRARAQAMFRELAPSYLARQKQLAPAPDTRYRLDHLDHDQLTFRTNTGVSFDLSTSEGLTFRNYGQLWYGKGTLLGTSYRLQVANLAQVSKASSAQ